MKKLLLILACILPLFAGCSASKGDVARKHLLWKVSDSNSSVYILGSIHFAEESFYPLDPVIENTFDRSDELAVEIDMSDKSLFEQVAVKSYEKGMLPENMSLDKMVPAELMKSLDSLSASWGFPVGMFSRYKPWTAAMTLTSLAITQKCLDANMGIDIHFLQRAHEAGKNIVSLETVDDQVNALIGEGLHDSVGIFYLKTTLQEIESIDSSIAIILDAWKQGSDSLLAVAMEMESAAGNALDSLAEKQIMELVYTSRNRKMAEKITAFLAEDRKMFIVVGAAHLAGMDESVLDLLRRQGFTVEQL